MSAHFSWFYSIACDALQSIVDWLMDTINWSIDGNNIDAGAILQEEIGLPNNQPINEPQPEQPISEDEQEDAEQLEPRIVDNLNALFLPADLSLEERLALMALFVAEAIDNPGQVFNLQDDSSSSDDETLSSDDEGIEI